MNAWVFAAVLAAIAATGALTWLLWRINTSPDTTEASREDATTGGG